MGKFFAKPVNTAKHKDYLEKIAPNKPVDLGTVMANLDGDMYRDLGEVVSDVNMVWENCFKYNKENTRVYQIALRTQKQFSAKVQRLDRDNRTARRSRTPKRC